MVFQSSPSPSFMKNHDGFWINPTQKPFLAYKGWHLLALGPKFQMSSRETLFVEGATISHKGKERDDEAAIKDSLRKIQEDFDQMGIPQDYVRNYYQGCAGKCLVGDLMCCIKHECGPTPLPPGFMDKAVFSAQLNLLNYRVGDMSRMFEEKKAK